MADAAEVVSVDTQEQVAAWKFMLSLRGLDSLPEVKLYLNTGGQARGLLAGCASHRLDPANRVYVKVDTRDRRPLSDFETDKGCVSFSFSSVIKVEASS